MLKCFCNILLSLNLRCWRSTFWYSMWPPHCCCCCCCGSLWQPGVQPYHWISNLGLQAFWLCGVCVGLPWHHLYRRFSSEDGALIAAPLNGLHSLFVQTQYYQQASLAVKAYLSLPNLLFVSSFLPPPFFSLRRSAHHCADAYSCLMALVSGRIILSQSSIIRSYDLQRGTLANHVQTALLHRAEGAALPIAHTVPQVIINLRQSTGLWQIDCNITPLHHSARHCTVRHSVIEMEGYCRSNLACGKREHSREIRAVWDINLVLQVNYSRVTSRAVPHSLNDVDVNLHSPFDLWHSCSEDSLGWTESKRRQHQGQCLTPSTIIITFYYISTFLVQNMCQCTCI